MKTTRFPLLAAVLSLMVSGCGGSPKPNVSEGPEWHPPTELLERYADKNGVVTRGAIERGLRADFAAADKNHDGCLDAAEARAVNEQRWKEAASASSPLIDFLHTGCIDFDEFAAEPRSLFEQLDKHNHGYLTPKDMHIRPKSPDTSAQ